MARSTPPRWEVVRETWKEHGGDLGHVFRTLNWGNPAVSTVTVELAESGQIALTPIASLKNFHAFELQADTGSKTSTIRQIQKEVSRVYPDNVLVLKDSDRVRFEWPRRKADGGIRYDAFTTKLSEPNQLTCQKLAGVGFQIREINDATLEDVRTRVYGIGTERVTRRFYERFRDEHESLSNSISSESESSAVDHNSYASLLLNRLMFVYFLQKKEFLGGKTNLLTLALKRCNVEGVVFYKNALLPLFFEGFNGQSAGFSTPFLNEIWGDIPYVNGGIFSPRKFEETSSIEIPNSTFERIFDFFETFDWHLDARPLGAQNEINPEVLGYIFEQYINYTADGKKDNGAYYTPEDVTGYMSAQSIFASVLESFAEIWPDCYSSLRDDPSRFLNLQLLHGAKSRSPLEWLAPNEELRRLWNGDPQDWPAFENVEIDREFCLPGETWPEMFSRRRHVESTIARLGSEGPIDVDYLVSMNVNLSEVARNIINHSSDLADLEAAWTRISQIRVIDPTCGSGAFLFAALGCLEDIYEAILDQMEAENAIPNVLERFTGATRRYQIRKHIAMENLYGTDIMEDAIETAKLRIFLSLVAVLDDPSQIEPLPDLDFNLKAGNLVVGLANIADADRIAPPGTLGGLYDFREISAKIRDFEALFDKFKKAEVSHISEIPRLKNELLAAQQKLRIDSNLKYMEIAGIDIDAAEEWVTVSKPFHWFIEFPEVMSKGGFDVVIGNPPYIRINDTLRSQLIGYKTAKLPDFYAGCTERSIGIAQPGSRIGLIVPNSSQFSRDFDVLRDLFNQSFEKTWVSTFDRRPSAIFTGKIGVRNSIWLAKLKLNSSRNEPMQKFVTTTNRWRSEFRPNLFASLRYTQKDKFVSAGWERAHDRSVAGVFEALANRGANMGQSIKDGEHRLYFKGNALYYLQFFDEPPPLLNEDGNAGEHTMMSFVQFPTERDRDVALAICLGKYMYLWWFYTSDNLNVTKATIESLPISSSMFTPEQTDKLAILGNRLRNDLANNIEYSLYRSRTVGRYVIPNLSERINEVDNLIEVSLGLGDARRNIWEAFLYAKKGDELE